MISKMNSNENHLSVYWVHKYEWFPQWTQLETMYQSIEFIPKNYLNSEPKWKTMYQSIEFIPMNYFHSEPKWKTHVSVYWVHNYEWLQ